MVNRDRDAFPGKKAYAVRDGLCRSLKSFARGGQPMRHFNYTGRSDENCRKPVRDTPAFWSAQQLAPVIAISPTRPHSPDL